MRIAFSGSGGTGKTTLLNAVNETLKYPVIEEGVRNYLKDNGIKHLRELSPLETLKMQNYLLDKKEVTEAQSKFIADRTTIDNAVYAMYWLNREDDLQKALDTYITRCVQHALGSYDIIFIAPHGVIPLEDDGLRSAKPMYQFMIQEMIEGFLLKMRYTGMQIHMLQSVTLKDRVAEVFRVLAIIEEALSKIEMPSEPQLVH